MAKINEVNNNNLMHSGENSTSVPWHISKKKGSEIGQTAIF